MIFINLSLLLIGLLLYIISFYTPRQEFFFYFMAGMFFLIAGATGFAGYSDIITGSSIIYDNLNNTATVNYIYSNNPLWNVYLPFLEVLFSIYIFITLTVLPKNND